MDNGASKLITQPRRIAPGTRLSSVSFAEMSGDPYRCTGSNSESGVGSPLFVINSETLVRHRNSKSLLELLRPGAMTHAVAVKARYGSRLRPSSQ